MIVCMKKGCESPATKRGKLFVAHESKPEAVAGGCMSLCVCESHAASTSINDVMGDEMFDQIAEGFLQSGRLAPTRSLSRLEWIDLDSRESKEFARSMRIRPTGSA